jgi:hypothetical protein
MEDRSALAGSADHAHGAVGFQAKRHGPTAKEPPMMGIGLVLVVLLVIELAELALRVRRDGHAVQPPSADLLVCRWRAALPT